MSKKFLAKNYFNSKRILPIDQGIKNLDLLLNGKIELQLWLNWIIIDQFKIFWFDVKEIGSIWYIQNQVYGQSGRLRRSNSSACSN